MKPIIDLFLLALTVVYIVDVSGFTEAWRAALSRLLNVQSLRPLPPFDCGKCASFWACLLYIILTNNVSVPMVAYVAFLSLLATPMAQLLIFIREGLTALINILLNKVTY